jgi:hypothetical protein
MHRLPSGSAVRRIRIAALLLGARCLITPAAAGALSWSFVIGDRRLTAISVALLILAGLMVLLQWLIATRATCPLCLTPVLGTKECVRHRSARTLFGSHRLRVAAEVLLLNGFRCPYCGESSALKVRPRKRH